VTGEINGEDDRCNGYTLPGDLVNVPNGVIVEVFVEPILLGWIFVYSRKLLIEPIYCFAETFDDPEYGVDQKKKYPVV
jgi:hypothetical protein